MIALPIAHHRQFVADLKLRAKGQAGLGIYPHDKIFPLAGGDDDDKTLVGDIFNRSVIKIMEAARPQIAINAGAAGRSFGSKMSRFKQAVAAGTDSTLSLYCAKGDELVFHQLTEDGSTEFANLNLVLTWDTEAA